MLWRCANRQGIEIAPAFLSHPKGDTLMSNQSVASRLFGSAESAPPGRIRVCATGSRKWIAEIVSAAHSGS